MRKALFKISLLIISIIFFLLMLFNTFLSFFKTAKFAKNYKESLYYDNDIFIYNLLFLVIFILILILLVNFSKKIFSHQRLVLIVMILTFATSVFFSILRRDYVQFDPFNVIDQASNFIRGNYTGLDKGENYLYIYSHQITTVFVFQQILYLFGRATFILYLMQAISISYIIFMLYKISDVLFDDDEVNYYVIIVSLFFLPLIFYVAFVYGTLPGIFLVLISFYNFIKYIKEKKWYNLVITAFSINLSILLIGNNLINFIAIIITSTLLLLKFFDKKILIFLVITIFIMFYSKKLIINYYEYKSNKEISAGVNKITWIAMGMQEGDREAGWWNGFNYDIMPETNYNNDEVVKISLKSIKNRLNVFKNNPLYAKNFYQRKYENQFFDPTFQSFLITAPKKDFSENTKLEIIKKKILTEFYYGKTNKILFKIMKTFQIFIYLFSFIYAIYIFFKKRDVIYFLVPITFIGGTIFHMIWEAKSRYIFPYFVFLIPIATYSFVIFKNYIKVKIGGKIFEN